MNYFKKEGKNGKKKIIRRNRGKQALKHVISLRVSDEELELLSRISRSASKSLSDVLRDAIKKWQDLQNPLCLEMSPDPA